MQEIRNKLDRLKNLVDTNTYIEERIYLSYEDDEYYFVGNDVDDEYFLNIWKNEYDNNIEELLYYCGTHWENYIYDLFYPVYLKNEMDYFIYKYISESSKTIKDYFQKHKDEIFNPKYENYPKIWKTVFKNLPPEMEYVNKRFYYDLSSFLENRVYDIKKKNKINTIDRIRKSKASDVIFKDSNSGNSISFYHRSIVGWDLQNYTIYLFPYEFDSYKRDGTINEIKGNISNLRYLFDFLGFIPNINASIYSIFKNVPIEKYVEFVKLQQITYSPYEYCFAYGNWLNAVIATGYLGTDKISKNTYGYRVIAKDGHICNSLAEKTIDDWFYNNNIEHIKEPKYPQCVIDMIGSNVKADWLIEDIFIEYFGLQNDKNYAKKTSSKLLSCELNGIKLLALYPGDEYHLEKIFVEYIKNVGHCT
jgi:hypothetical protein